MGKTERKNNKYSYEFKKKAVEKYLSGELGGCINAARKLGLRNKTQLLNWTKLYKQDPELLKTDRRSLGSNSSGRQKQIKLNELSKDEQIEYLKMENAILKKVKALRKSYGER